MKSVVLSVSSYCAAISAPAMVGVGFARPYFGSADIDHRQS